MAADRHRAGLGEGTVGRGIDDDAELLACARRPGAVPPRLGQARTVAPVAARVVPIVAEFPKVGLDLAVATGQVALARLPLTGIGELHLAIGIAAIA